MDRPDPLPRPTKEEIALLPPFERLPLDRIHLIRSSKQAEVAARTLTEAGFVGLDTETSPVFTKNARPDGPHVIQLATLEHAFIIQVNSAVPMDFLREVLESNQLVKVGFGLKSDRGPLYRKLGIRLGSTIELSQAVRRIGYRQAVGVKAAVAIVLGRQLQKSKSTTRSNWALQNLKVNQLQYATDDAHAAIAVFHALGCPIPRAIAAGLNPSLKRPGGGV